MCFTLLLYISLHKYIYMSILLNHVKEIMNNERINQSRLADIWNVSRQTVNAIMTGRQHLTADRFEQLLRIYGYTLPQIVKKKVKNEANAGIN